MYPLYFGPVSTRAEVYSPLQNIAVWLAAWLYGHVSTDGLITALNDLGGRHSYSSGPLTGLLRDVRNAAELDSPGPAVRLLLHGPGQPAELPPSSAAINAVHHAGGAIVVRGAGGISHVLVPNYNETATEWTWFEETLPLPEPAWLTPGEADALLSQATNDAAVLIEAAGGTRAEVADPRLTVGTLADFYDTPGLPLNTTPRSAKLFARADQVAAVIETVVDRLGDHSFDPQLFGLWRHIRTARMAGVAYAVVDFQRTA